jgi:hypothetical protein
MMQVFQTKNNFRYVKIFHATESILDRKGTQRWAEEKLDKIGNHWFNLHSKWASATSA